MIEYGRLEADLRVILIRGQDNYLMRVHAKHDGVFILWNYLQHALQYVFENLSSIGCRIVAEVLRQRHLNIHLCLFESLKDINMGRCIDDVKSAIANSFLMYFIFDLSNILETQSFIQHSYHSVDGHVVHEGLVASTRFQYIHATRWQLI